MYIRIVNGEIAQYPYSAEQLRSSLSDVSFPKNIPDSLLNEYGVFKVNVLTAPEIDHTKKLIKKTPELINNEWVQDWQVIDKEYNELLQDVLQLRASEYPPMADYLDGIVKGDQAQVDKYIADCLAVKAKYPKPLPPG